MSPFFTPKRTDQLFQVISSPRFQRMEGLGNEVPFYICPFPPDEAADLPKVVQRLANRLETEAGMQVLTIDLYDLAIELLKKRGIFQEILDMEPEWSKDELLELLQNVLDSETYLAPAINEKIEETSYDVLFLTGIGEVYPYIRSHTLLNNLQTPLSHRPMVLFFPGKYTFDDDMGASLDLFGRLHDDQYYRAFNILDVTS